jgi:hypothetical protein
MAWVSMGKRVETGITKGRDKRPLSCYDHVSTDLEWMSVLSFIEWPDFG